MESARTLTTEDGVTLSYRLWQEGSQRRPLIILLHGMASNMTRWSEFVELTSLKNSWNILRLDLRGHGQSFYRGKVSAEIWSRDLIRILENEDYRRALLIGHSLGAQLAIQFASLYPRQTSGLVLIDPILGRASHGIARWGRQFRYLVALLSLAVRAMNRLGLRRRRIPQRDLRALDERMRKTVLAAGKQEELVRQYSSPWPDLKHFPTANYLQEIIEMVRPLPPLAAITAPVLVVLSKGVTYIAPEVSHQMITQFRDVETAMVDAYHWPLTERPTEIRQAIERWCGRLRERVVDV
ncbi:MAG: alpha/beta hydrolase [Acidiferrobacterales bacterium]|nr:alpha/beta hydrolase [Acidiferrobacterales bacterium]